MGRCSVPECGGTTEYDDGAQAIVCTTCGVVAAQDILTDIWEGEGGGSSLYFGPTTLKSLRHMGTVLVGQSNKEDRDRRNMAAMHQYVINVLSRMNSQGLAPRVDYLFERARTLLKFRWGKTAALMAGASMMVAMRENHKGVLMAQLANQMNVSPTKLCHAFMRLCRTLSLQVPPFDPLSLLPSIQSALKRLLSPAPSSSTSTPHLSPTIIALLLPLDPLKVLRTASSLSSLLSTLDPTLFAGRFLLPTSTAIVILALEAELASYIPSYVQLVDALSKELYTRKDMILERCRGISNLVAEWVTEVPWLMGFGDEDNKIGNKSRKKKLGHRDVVARGLKDVLQFKAEIQAQQRRRQQESEKLVSLTLEVGSDDEDSNNTHLNPPPTSKKRKFADETSQSSDHPSPLHLLRTRKKALLSALDLASLSLLSPHTLSPPKKKSRKPTFLNDLLSTRPPSRLHTLLENRGSEEAINDAELFDEGELEEIFRSEEEVRVLRGVFGWEEGEGVVGPGAGAGGDAGGDGDYGNWDKEDFELWEDVGAGGEKEGRNANGVGNGIGAEEEIVGEWREVSPGEDYNGGDIDREDGVADVDDPFAIYAEW
ncbi:hypothetical protein M422DRAFT_775914 [Sphaerobolus stellatus SS14]|nr:hypothetical protein M422DRAFT_775914 [Sphaerobolus stellatus SS14]